MQTLEVPVKLRLLQDVWNAVTMHINSCDGCFGARVRGSLVLRSGQVLQTTAAQPSWPKVAGVNLESHPVKSH